ncbi:hypothetical protein [Falsiroseomonas sp. HW251]|uniref:hypothetical protein n=1 Tax=Falsiroseomonas sp. HW251 TaxID=3390998 RepID=UPI003D3233A4
MTPIQPLTSGNILPVVAFNKEGAFLFSVPVNRRFSSWNDESVDVERIEITIAPDSAESSDLAIYYDPASYDETRTGGPGPFGWLIYRSSEFLLCLRNVLEELGIPREIADTVDYSEHGMQGIHGGEDYVSCDAHHLEGYLRGLVMSAILERLDQTSEQLVLPFMIAARQSAAGARITAALNYIDKLVGRLNGEIGVDVLDGVSRNAVGDELTEALDRWTLQQGRLSAGEIAVLRASAEHEWNDGVGGSAPCTRAWFAAALDFAAVLDQLVEQGVNDCELDDIEGEARWDRLIDALEVHALKEGGVTSEEADEIHNAACDEGEDAFDTVYSLAQKRLQLGAAEACESQ